MGRMSLIAAAHPWGKDLVRLRRDLHSHPEPGFQEKRTSAIVERTLRAAGIETKKLCGTGVVGLVRGARPGPTLLIRADMDALPVTEENEVPYRSKVPGRMHACGHDGHTAMGLVAARQLQKRRGDLAGNVKFMFQPAEEGPGGALPMIDAGILKNPKVDAAFAIHLWNDLPVGKVGVRSGPVFAGADEFTMKVLGKGGHGAAPHQTVDPVVIAANIVTASQAIVSRRVDPVKTAVVTFGQIKGGTRFNIIPDDVTLNGTVRTFEEPLRRQIKRDLRQIASGVAASFGAGLDFDYDDGYPPTVNDPKMTALAAEAVRDVLGPAGAVEQEVTMGAEDMSYVLQRVPGCYMVVGSMNRARGFTSPHHSARFDFDEDALTVGVDVWLRLAARYLSC
ncbi:MAG: amidohydrolase [Planctomycetes bacterium]|nr:amidohydrolase [Planctomycetota bacterium]